MSEQNSLRGLMVLCFRYQSVVYEPGQPAYPTEQDWWHFAELLAARLSEEWPVTENTRLSYIGDLDLRPKAPLPEGVAHTEHVLDWRDVGVHEGAVTITIHAAYQAERDVLVLARDETDAAERIRMMW